MLSEVEDGLEKPACAVRGQPEEEGARKLATKSAEETLDEIWKVEEAIKKQDESLTNKYPDYAAAALIQPVLDATDAKKLLIIPEGAAHVLPFGLLKDKNNRPLHKTHEIRLLHSPSVWLHLRGQKASVKQKLGPQFFGFHFISQKGVLTHDFLGGLARRIPGWKPHTNCHFFPLPPENAQKKRYDFRFSAI